MVNGVSDISFLYGNLDVGATTYRHHLSHATPIHPITIDSMVNKRSYVKYDEEMIQWDAQGPRTAYKCVFLVKSLSTLGPNMARLCNVKHVRLHSVALRSANGLGGLGKGK